jgi:hypothetical protein
MPFQNMAWLHGTNTSVRSPLTGQVFMTGPTDEEADRLLTALLVDALQQHTAFEIEASQEALSILDALKSDADTRSSPLQILARTGRMVGSDFLLQGYLYRFKDRMGRNYSAESPASIAFDLHLIDCLEEKLVWSGSFDETQQALTDDLRYFGTFLRRGGRWITAEEMAREAMGTMFKEFQQR